MARKALIEREKKRARLVARDSAKRAELKKLIKDSYLAEEEKLAAMRKLNKLPRNSSPIRMRNRCQLTGRPRGYLRKYRISRLEFRELALEGYLPGITKSSW